MKPPGVEPGGFWRLEVQKKMTLMRWTYPDGTVKTFEDIEEFKTYVADTRQALSSMKKAYWYLSLDFKCGLKMKDEFPNVAARHILIELIEEIESDWKWLHSEMKRLQK